ncbi:EthD family reductase [Ktedonobacter racemifer]|uniref:Ethyl tert-butyl ether degradation EthD n=1 Tax=Ktedonobacter racemifer DSM 44963 TaxID=485913 RepID=D6TYH4_KTERA|nr:EthD family reductase [Ktedonobacter racemifer]EFH83254.1 Ethyl tert-butyl ether degradation EthD [Ktedonobacter racemifer DSM 44963]
MFCASVAYPNQQGGSFDFEYFAYKHVPLFVRFLGKNCVKFEVHKSLNAPGAPASQFLAVAYFWVKSGEEFGVALAQHSQEIYSDIPKFTDIEPVRQWSEVVQAAEA